MALRFNRRSLDLDRSEDVAGSTAGGYKFALQLGYCLVRGCKPRRYFEEPMPFSFSSQLSAIVGYAEDLKPRSVLDVGVGMGQYGFLLRTNLENVELFDVDGLHGTKRPRERWGIVIDGIEGFPEYLTPVHEYAYNKIMIGDAMALLPSIGDDAYELVIAIDIVEHFDADVGSVFLHHCKRIARRAALVSTPKDFVEQVVPANPLENHRSHWSQQAMVDAGYERTIENIQNWIAVCEK